MTENQEKELFSLLTKGVNGIQRLEGDVKELKTDVAVLKTDVAELKSDVAVIKTDIIEMKSDIGEMKSDIADLKEGQTRLEKDLQITNRSIAVMAGELNVTKARVEILEQRPPSN